MQDNTSVFFGSRGSFFFSTEYEKRGPGFFKFNDSLLDDKNFTEELKENIEMCMEKYRDVTNKILYWEMIKIEIRSLTLCKLNMHW